ncbi:MAG: UDP-2,4-diacetamido-2,4,6-trideoxy-beta-L-altropyranose hydrolase, partial [Candidatus Omnitrophica bacterium]|nr:UDP-2,4-diacetamido-2,4,6-trideoxy-beta-L-altropyranose hydrolase [Candidatus Omnitrophota bacterium]
KKMLNLMLKVDLCISGGGQTTYELARLGVPTIGICFAKNQLLNLKYGQKAEYLEFVGWFKCKNLFEKIEEIVESLNCAKEEKISLAGQKSVDGQGARRIIEEILKWTKKK